MEELQYYLQWMLKTIQIKIIHSLGGYTKAECYKYVNENGKYYFNLGIKRLAEQLEDIAIQNYGCSKQKWIDKIYSKIQETLKENVK